LHYINQETCPGIKKGGTLNVVRHDLDMRVPADNIPDAIIADLSKLDVAESMRIASIPLPEGCKLMGAETDFTIATIVPPVVVVEDPAAAAAAAKGAKGKGGKAAPKAAAAPAAAAAKPAAKKK
jgi:large subunit ribosomal protein L25